MRTPDLDGDAPSLADPALHARHLPPAPHPCFFHAVCTSSLLFRGPQQAVHVSVERAEPSARAPSSAARSEPPSLSATKSEPPPPLGSPDL
ncbi:hypothetical protein GUJ93_ZPchr0011g27570 [Zizania palustris]|uniref:Uncharacterized protein n=1 Tax=Zizania palustris TaxID=103762 RepID=A0A8J6BQ27_ZIZPA|nr:hypothetical protein GUJ93_ZPchr0011g27570 [Zizania palustris]